MALKPEAALADATKDSLIDLIVRTGTTDAIAKTNLVLNLLRDIFIPFKIRSTTQKACTMKKAFAHSFFEIVMVQKRWSIIDVVIVKR